MATSIEDGQDSQAGTLAILGLFGDREDPFWSDICSVL
jgi:hypothetical protein